MKRTKIFNHSLAFYFAASIFTTDCHSGRDRDVMWARADSIVTLLSVERFSAVAAMLHYPPTYTATKRAVDEALFASELHLINDKIGTLAEYSRISGKPLCYVLTGGGGDPEYWASVSRTDTMSCTYSGHYTHFGKGFLIVHFARIQGKWETEAITFGLDPSVAGARTFAIDTIVELVRDQARTTGTAVPSDVRDLVAKQVPDLSQYKEPADTLKH